MFSFGSMLKRLCPGNRQERQMLRPWAGCWMPKMSELPLLQPSMFPLKLKNWSDTLRRSRKVSLNMKSASRRVMYLDLSSFFPCRLVDLWVSVQFVCDRVQVQTLAGSCMDTRAWNHSSFVLAGRLSHSCSSSLKLCTLRSRAYF